MPFGIACDAEYERVILTADYDLMHVFIAQNAASLMQACSEFAVNRDDIENGTAKTLADYLGWDKMGLIGALQSQTVLLYSLAQDYVMGKSVDFLGSRAKLRKLIARALAAYQEWKNRFCENEAIQEESYYPDDSAFATLDWTALNPRLLVDT